MVKVLKDKMAKEVLGYVSAKKKKGWGSRARAHTHARVHDDAYIREYADIIIIIIITI